MFCPPQLCVRQKQDRWVLVPRPPLHWPSISPCLVHDGSQTKRRPLQLRSQSRTACWFPCCSLQLSSICFLLSITALERVTPATRGGHVCQTLLWLFCTTLTSLQSALGPAMTNCAVSVHWKSSPESGFNCSYCSMWCHHRGSDCQLFLFLERQAASSWTRVQEKSWPPSLRYVLTVWTSRT